MQEWIIIIDEDKDKELDKSHKDDVNYKEKDIILRIYCKGEE